MFTDYFKCKKCGQVWKLMIFKGHNMKEQCCPSCGEHNLDKAPQYDIDKIEGEA